MLLGGMQQKRLKSLSKQRVEAEGKETFPSARSLFPQRSSFASYALSPEQRCPSCFAVCKNKSWLFYSAGCADALTITVFLGSFKLCSSKFDLLGI